MENDSSEISRKLTIAKAMRDSNQEMWVTWTMAMVAEMDRSNRLRLTVEAGVTRVDSGMGVESVAEMLTPRILA